jgi:hypothetical protein
MRKPIFFVAAITTAALIMGWLLDPSITFIAGVLTWILLLVLASGAEDPNPIRTATAFYAGIPDEPLAHRAMMPVNAQRGRKVRGRVIWALFLSGSALVSIGIYWMGIKGIW